MKSLHSPRCLFNTTNKSAYKEKKDILTDKTINKNNFKPFLSQEIEIQFNTINEMFHLFSNSSKHLSTKSLYTIFVICGLPLSFKDVQYIFSERKNQEKIANKNNVHLSSKDDANGFWNLQEFKRVFFSEKAEKTFATIMKKYQNSYNDFEKSKMFFPNSLKEILDLLIYKLKRIKIINELHGFNLTLESKIQLLSKLFSLKIGKFKEYKNGFFYKTKPPDINKIAMTLSKTQKTFFEKEKNKKSTILDFKKKIENEKNLIKMKFIENENWNKEKNLILASKSNSFPQISLCDFEISKSNVKSIHKSTKKYDSIEYSYKIMQTMMDYNVINAKQFNDANQIYKIIK